MVRTKMLIAKIVLTVAAAYVIVVAIIAVTQTSVIFPAGMANAQAPVLPSEALRLEVATADGERLVGTHFRPRAGAGDADALVLGFGGNAANADGTAMMLRGLYPDAHVVAFHYRGYGPSSGDASAAALLEDALAVHDAALSAVKPKRVIAVGISIGGGLAAYLAKHRVLAGLILVSPFDSLAALARTHYPWAPVDLLLRHRIPTARYLEGRPTPTALIAAALDRIVPAARTQALRPAIGNLVFDRTIPGVGHNGIYGHPDFPVAMGEALSKILVGK
ncbi:MAG: alpha/beta hydrolase [Alphaproteobacteria bacterium]|nr:alpha/beta hydrolase [Alphaproteobacteria bacterium]